MSGAHGDEWPSKGVPNSIMLMKPFAPAQLVTAIWQLLNCHLRLRKFDFFCSVSYRTDGMI
jgi:hypothetical protein